MSQNIREQLDAAAHRILTDGLPHADGVVVWAIEQLFPLEQYRQLVAEAEVKRLARRVRRSWPRPAPRASMQSLQAALQAWGAAR